MHPWRQFAIDIGADIANGPWIAGGAARRLFQNETGETDFLTGDIDIFLPLSEYADVRKKVRAAMSNRFPKDVYASSSQDDDKHTVTEQYMIGKRKTRVQLIGQGYDNISALFKSFDFTVAQFAVSGNFIAFTDEARADLNEMRLALASPIQKRKGTTPVRTNKYCRYGFTPAPGVLRWLVLTETRSAAICGSLMRTVMLIDIQKAAVHSMLGETITICRYDGEIIAFVNGKPMPYRAFYQMLMQRVFSQVADFTSFQKCEIGNSTADLMKTMSDIGVCNLSELVSIASGGKLYILMSLIIDDVIAKACERSATPEEALEYLVNQIEEQYESALARDDK